MIKKIDHLGIAVRSIEAARKFYEEVLGLVCEKEEVVTSQKVRTAFFTVGDIHIELLEPTSDDSPIAGFLEKKGEGFHHIAYRTDDIDKQMEPHVRMDANLSMRRPSRAPAASRWRFCIRRAPSACSPSFVNRTLSEGV